MATLHNIRHQDKNTLIAFALIGLGITFILGIGNLILPFIFLLFVAAPGFALLAVYHYTQHEAAAPLAIPGTLIAGTGLLLAFQSLTDYWESWSYAWALYGVFFGYGLVLMGKRLDQNNIVNVGRSFIVISGAIFAFFGLLFTILTSSFLSILIPLAFIAAGAYLLLKKHGLDEDDKPKRAEPVMEEGSRKIKINVDAA